MGIPDQKKILAQLDGIKPHVVWSKSEEDHFMSLIKSAGQQWKSKEVWQEMITKTKKEFIKFYSKLYREAINGVKFPHYQFILDNFRTGSTTTDPLKFQIHEIEEKENEWTEED